MKLFIEKSGKTSASTVVLDDMILTKDLPTSAGSKMLDGYMSLFDAEIIGRLEKAGYSAAGKANSGELAIDLLGETSYYGACENDGKLVNASAEIVKSGECAAALGLDVNGTPRRAAALSGLVYIKPTYGTVSRYGTIPAACSGETIGITAKTADECRKVLAAVAGHDAKDGTSLSDEQCALVNTTSAPIKKVAVAAGMLASADEETKARIEKIRAALTANGIEVIDADDKIPALAKTAWNILMSAELCNNVSRYDGVKYGYRTPNYTTIDELYTNSRTEAFGDLLKTAILFGSETLSTDNYMKVYDKALRMRRVICEYFGKLFEDCDAFLLPACSKSAYTKADTDSNKYISYDEALYTAPASITGLPAVVFGGAQLIGKAFSDSSLLDAAALYEKEGK